MLKVPLSFRVLTSATHNCNTPHGSTLSSVRVREHQKVRYSSRPACGGEIWSFGDGRAWL